MKKLESFALSGKASVVMAKLKIMTEAQNHRFSYLLDFNEVSVIVESSKN